MRDLAPEAIARAARLVRELERRLRLRPTILSSAAPNPEGLREDFTEHQWEMVLCVARMLACLGTRRSGKSRTWLRQMVYDAATTPNIHQLYINTTRRECWRIGWRGAKGVDGIVPLNDRYHLGAVCKVGTLSAHFPNGSLIELIGADDEASIERALGGEYFRVLLDEAQKFPHLAHALMEVLGPAMMDSDGQIILGGSPNTAAVGYFFDLTKDAEPAEDVRGWAVRVLTALDNPIFGDSQEERYENTVAKFCKRFGLTPESPEVRRAWGPQWVMDDALFVYDVHRVSTEELCYGEMAWTSTDLPLPKGGTERLAFPDIAQALRNLPVLDGDPEGKLWRFGLSADFGYDPDPFALCGTAWHPYSPRLYELFSWKKSQLVPDQQLYLARLAYEALNPVYFVGDADGGGRPLVVGWAKGWTDRESLPIQPAEKKHKAAFQGFVNNDIRTLKVALLSDSPLLAEMQRLSWLVLPSGKRVEHVARGEGSSKRYPNDCADAFLYNHREARHHRYEAYKAPPAYGSEAYYKAVEDRLEQECLEDMESEHESDWFQ